MTERRITKKTFSLPQHIVDRLDEVSSHTGFSQSTLVLQALGAYLHRYEQEDSLESWLYWRGLTSGTSADTGDIEENNNENYIDWNIQ